MHDLKDTLLRSGLCRRGYAVVRERIDAGGSVSLSFAPELAPPVEACVRDAMAGVRGAPGWQEVPLSLSSRL